MVLPQEDLLAEAWELLQCGSIRAHALRSGTERVPFESSYSGQWLMRFVAGFAGCIFRFLTQFTETQKRVRCKVTKGGPSSL
jgi:hypothetical protein